MEKELKPCIVAGHSYGGALALQLSVDYTDQVLAVVSIAGFQNRNGITLWLI